jgi:glycosyltransferase involved in cell wall biosynthesis
VPREQLLRELRQADVLMLPHGFDGGFAPVEYETIFPTKTIEYLISGRPILAHSPPGCFLTRFLNEHGCALVVEERTVAAVKAALLRLQTEPALRESLVRSALKTAEMFQVTQVAEHLRQTITKTGNPEPQTALEFKL